VVHERLGVGRGVLGVAVGRVAVSGIALWGIELVVAGAFRPGYIVNMGTIHFARWFRPPGSECLVFLSNYDGSWESYLEDFITKAYPGQNAAWSNAIGFPRTKWLIRDGAQKADYRMASLYSVSQLVIHYPPSHSLAFLTL
jgi:hypothetical protein